MEQQQKRNYLISGAAGILGTHVARLLAAQGHNLCLLGRNKYKLDELSATFATKGDVLTLECDLLDVKRTQEVVVQAVHHFGELHGLAHLVGGFGPPAPCQKTPPQRYRQLWEGNFLTAVNITQPLIEHLAPGSCLIYMSSFLAHDPIEGMGAYAASKAALVAWARTLAREVRSQVRVNVISTVKIESLPSQARRANIGTPPEELAQVVQFILSDQAQGIHGALIPVYGTFFLENTAF
jgi:NAD(P)-dependent dehydrogenase (short-subunit alcohol dehydrogenase family)